MPPAWELQAYENVQHGLAERIVVMAESQLVAQNTSELTPIQAEARSLLLATIAISYFPWLAVIAAVVLALTGHGYGALITGAGAVVVAGPQLIAAIRRTKG